MFIMISDSLGVKQMPFGELVDYIGQYTAQLITLGALIIGFVLGVMFARSRIKWQLEGELQEAQDGLEWERANSVKLLQQAEAKIKELAAEASDESSDMENEQIRLLRKELQRLYQVLQKSWLAETHSCQRIQQLEARISVLTKQLKPSPQTELELESRI